MAAVSTPLALRSPDQNAKPGCAGVRLRYAALTPRSLKNDFSLSDPNRSASHYTPTDPSGWLSVSRWRSLPLGIATRLAPTHQVSEAKPKLTHQQIPR